MSKIKCATNPRVTDHFTYERKINGRSVYKATKVFTGRGEKGRVYEKGDRRFVGDRFAKIFSIGCD